MAIAAIQDIVAEAMLTLTPILEQHIETSVGTAIAAHQEQQQEQTEEPMETPEAARLKALEDKLAEADRVATERSFDDALSQAVDGFNPQYRQEALAHLRNTVRDSFTQSDSGWLSKEGKTVAEAVGSFFDSPFGRHLLPPKVSSGSGTTKPEPVAPSGQQSDVATDLARVMF
jgi:hypothetical protein